MKVICGCIILKNNQVLMVKEAKKSCYGQWNFPAGHLEEGENIVVGAIREVFEETGCKVKLTGMLPITTDFIHGETFVLFHFLADIVEENIFFNTEEILDVQWIKLSDLAKMKKDQLRRYDHNIKIVEYLKMNRIYALDILDER